MLNYISSVNLGFVWAETLSFGMCLNVGPYLLCSFPFWPQLIQCPQPLLNMWGGGGAYFFALVTTFLRTCFWPHKHAECIRIGYGYMACALLSRHWRFKFWCPHKNETWSGATYIWQELLYTVPLLLVPLTLLVVIGGVMLIRHVINDSLGGLYIFESQ